MISMRFSTAGTYGSAGACYVHTPCENSRRSDNLDVSVKSLALNSCGENFILKSNFLLLLKTKRMADLDTRLRRWARTCFLLIARFENRHLKGESEILWLNNHQTAIVQN
jgi:hypothetical protein